MPPALPCPHHHPAPDDDALLVPALRAKSAFFGPGGAQPGAAGAKAVARATPPPPRPPATARIQAARGGGGGDNQGDTADPTAPAAPPAVYTAATRFTSRTELYRGAISTVYAARCPLTRRPVILKEYDRGRMKPKHAARVERECATMATISDLPGVVRLYGRFDDAAAARTTLVVEHCTGGDLFRALVLARGRGLGARYTAAAVVAPLLVTLAAAHARGVIHRDIKPENLFVEGATDGGAAAGAAGTAGVAGGGAVRLGDFGLALDARRELPFARAGTLDYMAPEVLANPALTDLDEGPSVTRAALAARGARPYGPAVDVWAVGVLAYECVVGRPPFDGGGDDAATAARVLYSDAVALPAAHGGEWASFVAAALAKRPHDRPSAAALLAHPWLAMHGVGTAAVGLGVGGGLRVVGGAMAVSTAPPSSVDDDDDDDDDASSAAAASSSAPPSPCSSMSGDDVEGWPPPKVARPGARAVVTPPPPPPPPPPARRHPLASQRALAASTHADRGAPAVPRSGASFVELLRQAPPGGAAPLVGGSGDAAAAREGRGGLRVRVAHYFHRQRHAGEAT